MNLNKTAPVSHPVIDIIRQRWSPRSFSAKQISQTQMDSVMEAARWSASCANEQPWKYYYAFHGTPGFEKLLDCLSGGNQPWCKNASVLIIAATRRTNEKDGKINEWAEHDLGLANAQLLLQSTSMGIYGHPMAGFDKVKASESLDLEEDVQPICAIALGFLDDADKLEEPFRSREKAVRTRKEIGEFTQVV